MSPGYIKYYRCISDILVALRLNAAFPTLLCHEESTATSRTSMTTVAKLLGLAGARAVVTDTDHHLLSLAT